MVHGIARRGIAFVAGRISRLAGRERPQTDRRQEPPLDGIDDSLRTFTIDERNRQSTHGKYLIRPERVVAGARHMIDVHDIGEPSSVLVPEPFDKRAAASLERLTPVRLQLSGDAQGIQPESLDRAGYRRANDVSQPTAVFRRRQRGQRPSQRRESSGRDSFRFSL